jgi:hypothetical protein
MLIKNCLVALCLGFGNKCKYNHTKIIPKRFNMGMKNIEFVTDSKSVEEVVEVPNKNS